MYITDRQTINGIGFMWDPKVFLYKLQFTIEIGVLKDPKGIRTGTGMAHLFKGEWEYFDTFAKKKTWDFSLHHLSQVQFYFKSPLLLSPFVFLCWR